MASKYVVYMHKNKINNKVYIGQTSQSLQRRWQNGFGYKHNEYFFNAIQKYGWDNFEHIILYTNCTLEEANFLEEALIKKYDSCNKEKGYNLRLGGNNSSPSQESIEKMRQSHLGKKMSEEQKEKISKSNIGKHNYVYTNDDREKMSKLKQKQVLCITTNQIFSSIEEAEKWCGLAKHSHIGSVCQGKRLTCGKHPITQEPLKWAFVKEEDNS